MNAVKKKGRPTHQPTDQTRKQVAMLSGFGLTLENVARVIGIDYKTLMKHYAEEVELGKAQVQAQVVSALFQNIKNGNVAAQIFWCKTQLGWKEKVTISVDRPLPRAEFVIGSEPMPDVIDVTEPKNGTSDS
jgi:hypothetical protein